MIQFKLEQRDLLNFKLCGSYGNELGMSFKLLSIYTRSGTAV